MSTCDHRASADVSPASGETGADARHLAAILDCVAEGVITVTREKRIRFFNRAAEQITGFPKEEAIGRPCREVFRTEVCDVSCILETVETSGRSVINRPVRILDHSGRPVLVSVNAAALYDSDGQIIGGIETFRDLSTEDELRRQIEKSYTFHDIVSRHPEMHRLFTILPDVAESDFPVLVEGESGTGKELFARALHNLSRRKGSPFVAVNCGALPDQLLESELFGYRKGAFTDAKTDKRGRFDLAKGGTLFLDEIGDVSPALQVKLLRVLQEKTYEPLGANEPVNADVRILAATHRNLADEVRAGRFREDLFYRLNVLRLELPPLRERRCDIPLLAIPRFRIEFGAHLIPVSQAPGMRLGVLRGGGRFRGYGRVPERSKHHLARPDPAPSLSGSERGGRRSSSHCSGVRESGKAKGHHVPGRPPVPIPAGGCQH